MPAKTLIQTVPPTMIRNQSDGVIQTVVAIEYQDGRPSSVVVREEKDNTAKPWFRRGEDSPVGVTRCDYGVEWCKRDSQLYWHMHGCGGSISEVAVLGFSKPSPPKAKLWLAPGVTAVEYVGRTNPRRKPIGKTRLRNLGYELIASPLDLTSLHTGWTKHVGQTCNPFDVADGDVECQYCKHCRDWLPDRDGVLCEHVEWCDECSWYIYSKTHVRLDSDDGKPTIHSNDPEVA
ncbi:MAG: hypothetical protein QM754_18380 [Tepidisphaeraceae bacterium]